MTQHRIHRFDFNSLRDFRGPIVMKATNEPLVVDLPPPPPPPVFNESELAAARAEGKKQGYADGFTAGQSEANAKADQKVQHATEVIAQLAAMTNEMRGRYSELLSTESEQLSALVVSIAQKVVGTMLDSNAAQAIQAVVTDCLPVIFSKPKLVIELNPNMFDSTIDSIEQQLRAHSFEGEVQFKANEAMGVSDVNLDWGAGQMQRSAAALWNEIEALIARMPLTVHRNNEAITETLPPETPIGE